MNEKKGTIEGMCHQKTLSSHLSGIILINKPRGPSSHQVTAWVGKMLQTPVGHTGTLDPMVSGVLVIMLNKAVKLAPLLLQSDKDYIALMRVHGDISSENLESVLNEFSGRIYQRPPRKSAVKRNLRIRSIHEIKVLDIDQRLILLKIRCDAGTYIRSLIHHIGLRLGVGAHLEELRRTRSGSFDEKDTCTLHDLKRAVELAKEGNEEPLSKLIIPMSTAVNNIARIIIRDTAIDAICHGAVLAAVGIIDYTHFTKGDVVGILTRSGELVCLGKALIDSDKLQVQKTGLVAAPTGVVMNRGTYPRGWRRKKEKEQRKEPCA